MLKPAEQPKAPEQASPKKEAPKPQSPKGPAEVSLVAQMKQDANQDPDKRLAQLAGAQEPEHTKPETTPAPEQKTPEGAHIKVDLSPATLDRMKSLRDSSIVGKDKYGKKGLVNTNHEGATTVAEHEAAQAKAYNQLDQKIEAGLVDPTLIGTEIVDKLGVSPDVLDPPATHAEIPGRVNQELRTFVEKNLITEHEAEVIGNEMERFSALYHEAYPGADATKAYELVRNNARTIAYQTVQDKTVFSGSDHGIKHIIEGNAKFAYQMFDSLEQQGMPVSIKDKVLTLQTIYDHDCGYTCGCGQAPSGFEASKDHPVFSAKFVSSNKEYYEDKFGEDGYTVIQDSILNHSYPTELPQQLDPQREIHSELVRSISSTVDSLGVTAETKPPLFFTSPESVRVLLKIKLAMETVGDGKTIPKEYMEKYKGELQGIAAQETNPERKTGYENSINNFFNEFTADTTLGHYTGVVDKVAVVKREEDGKLIPQVDMRMSRIHALLGDMFGGDLEKQAFSKAMKDFGMSKGELQKLGTVLEDARRNGVQPTAEQLQFDSAQARFVLNPQLAEYASDEFTDIRSVMDEAYQVTVRGEINRALEQMQDGSTQIDDVMDMFTASISSKTTPAEIKNMRELFTNLSDTSSTGKKDDDGNVITVAMQARKALREPTQAEKDFLGI